MFSWFITFRTCRNSKCLIHLNHCSSHCLVILFLQSSNVSGDFCLPPEVHLVIQDFCQTSFLKVIRQTISHSSRIENRHSYLAGSGKSNRDGRNMSKCRILQVRKLCTILGIAGRNKQNQEKQHLFIMIPKSLKSVFSHDFYRGKSWLSTSLDLFLNPGWFICQQLAKTSREDQCRLPWDLPCCLPRWHKVFSSIHNSQ